MRIRDIVSWNALLLGYADNEQNDSAVEMFFGHLSTNSSDSTAEFLSPNSRTYVSVLKACGNTSDLEAGRLIHRSVCRDGKECEEILVTSLVDFYGKSGKTSSAQQATTVEEKLIEFLICFAKWWSGIFSPIGSHSSLFFRRLLVLVWLTKAWSCCKRWRVDKNRIGEAVELARGMPCEASVVTWTSLLDGCRKWKDVKRAEEVFKLLSDAGEAGAYDLLLNTYLDC